YEIAFMLKSGEDQCSQYNENNNEQWSSRNFGSDCVEINLTIDRYGSDYEKSYAQVSDDFNRIMRSLAKDFVMVIKCSAQDLKNKIQSETEAIEKMAEIVPALYERIDKATYRAILESEDDALKQLDTLEKSDKSLTGAAKAALEKQEAAL